MILLFVALSIDLGVWAKASTFSELHLRSLLFITFNPSFTSRSRALGRSSCPWLDSFYSSGAAGRGPGTGRDRAGREGPAPGGLGQLKLRQRQENGRPDEGRLQEGPSWGLKARPIAKKIPHGRRRRNAEKKRNSQSSLPRECRSF